MSGQESRGSVSEYQADEQAGVADSAGEYQAEKAMTNLDSVLKSRDITCQQGSI